MLGDLTMARRHGHAPLPPDSSFPRRPSHESFGKGHAPAQGLLATVLVTVKGLLQTTVCTIRRPKESCSSLRRFYKQFKGGATRLWADGRVAWRHRKLDERDRCRLLDWRTARIARRAPWEVLHVLWLVFNPMPPPLGFFCIAAAYRWPRMLLSPQFHEPEQKARFARDDDRKRAEARAMLRGGQLASALVAASLCVNDEAALRAQFRGPLAWSRFDARDRAALLMLADPAPRCCPCSVLSSRRLAARAAELREDDQLLRPALLSLKSAELHACAAERALVVDAAGDAALRMALERWLDMRGRLGAAPDHAPFVLALLADAGGGLGLA